MKFTNSVGRGGIIFASDYGILVRLIIIAVIPFHSFGPSFQNHLAVPLVTTCSI